MTVEYQIMHRELKYFQMSKPYRASYGNRHRADAALMEAWIGLATTCVREDLNCPVPRISDRRQNRRCVIERGSRIVSRIAGGIRWRNHLRRK